MKKAAFAVWNERLAPVFDVARQLFVIEVESGAVVRDYKEEMPEEPPVRRALRLAESGVDVLVCGAVSGPLHQMLLARGIEVIPFVTGELTAVTGAWLKGDMDPAVFSMPGCCRRGRGRQVGAVPKVGGLPMTSGRGGRVPGARKGGRGKGRPGKGPVAAGVGGLCLCPSCGRREPHLQGEPCASHRCPDCGSVMVRE